MIFQSNYFKRFTQLLFIHSTHLSKENASELYAWGNNENLNLGGSFTKDIPSIHEYFNKNSINVKKVSVTSIV